jgi:heptosyltransferase-2
MQKEIPDCKKFTGYKPCHKGINCYENGCPDPEPFGTKILLINLDAMGDILMTTAQLRALKRKFPQSTIYWITLNNTVPLLFNNPYVDKVFAFSWESHLILSQIDFDYVMNVDKSQRSCAFAMDMKAKNLLGFVINSNGQIVPAGTASEYNYVLGMDDHLKFKINKRTGEDYLAETFELDYQREDYVYVLSDEELNFIADFKDKAGIKATDKVIGFNTGCSNLYPNKKMTVEQHRYLIEKFLSIGKYKIALFGGPEDEERNRQIYAGFEERIISTPTNLGIRRGLCFENIADVIITGDSFGMHAAIALKKYVIAWFGLSCWEEIELFGRGIKLIPQGLECAPCWKKACPYNIECRAMIDLDKIVRETVNYLDNLNK